MDTSEPVGLTMSLDDMIKSQTSKRKAGDKRHSSGSDGRDGGGRGFKGGLRIGSRGRGVQKQRSRDEPVRVLVSREQAFGRSGGFRGGSGGRSGAQRGGWGGSRDAGYQQQTFQQQRGRGGGRRGGRGDPGAYKKDQSCYEDDAGNVCFKFHETEIVKIKPNGDMMLTTGGFHTISTLWSLNDCLRTVDMQVVATVENDATSDWNVSDGKSITRFRDGMVVPGKGARWRANKVLHFFSPEAAAAAEAANPAAAAAHMMPQGLPAGLMGSNIWGVPYGALVSMGARPAALGAFGMNAGAHQNGNAAYARTLAAAATRMEPAADPAPVSRSRRGGARTADYDDLPDNMDVEDYLEVPPMSASRVEERRGRGFQEDRYGRMYGDELAADDAQIRRQQARGRYAY